jgi:hypothetical protein
MTPQLSTAYHEAAHAVIGLALGLPMVCAVLHPERGGRCDHGGATAAQLHAFCLMLYAGREAQRVLNGTLWLWLHPYSGDDKLAAPYADQFGGIRELRRQARALVKEWWPHIDHVTHELSRREYLAGWQIRRMMFPPASWCEVTAWEVELATRPAA